MWPFCSKIDVSKTFFCCFVLFIWLVSFFSSYLHLISGAGVQPSILMGLAELGQWLERMILKVFPTEMRLRFHDLWSFRSTTTSVHSLNWSLQEQQQTESASPALVLPVGRSDVESTQLAWKRRLRAVVRIEPGWLVMLHIQHLLVVHGAAPRSMGNQPPALGRATVLEEKESRKPKIYNV